jgi:hypothetical protein
MLFITREKLGTPGIAANPLLSLFPDFPATFEKPLGYRRASTGGIHEARDKARSSAAEL